MQILFTPASLLDLFSQIEELSDKDINVTEYGDGNIEITIGDSTYSINSNTAEEVEVAEDVVEDVEEINLDSYDEIESEIPESINGGILKTVAKALLLRGLIKLSSKLIN